MLDYVDEYHDLNPGAIYVLRIMNSPQSDIFVPLHYDNIQEIKDQLKSNVISEDFGHFKTAFNKSNKILVRIEKFRFSY